MENNSALSDSQKEALALTTMRLMLQQYSEKHHIPFDDAFFQFSTSAAYPALFDYETEIWKEGPDYLMDIFTEALSLNAHKNKVPA